MRLHLSATLGSAGRSLTVAPLVSAVALVLVASVARPAAQRAPVPEGQDAGYLARGTDREVRAVYDASRGVTVATLTLIPPGTGGSAPSMSMMFETSFPGRAPEVLPTAVDVRIHAGPLSDSRVQRTVELEWTLDPQAPKPLRLWYFGSAWGHAGYVAPGDEIPLVRFVMSAADLRSLAAAEHVVGNALGFAFALTPAEHAALRGYLRLLLPEDVPLIEPPPTRPPQ